MKRTFRKYNLIVTLILLPIISSLLITSIFIEPLNGNMTRIGGYLESDFGWSGEQLSFDTPLYTKSVADYDHYSDVVVLGDSFSNNAQWSWTNYFVDRTGLSLQVFHFDQGGYERIVNSRLFAEQPPRLFIVESVENQLKNRFGATASSCPQPVTRSATPLPISPLHTRTSLVSRSSKTELLNFDLAADYLGKAIPRQLGINTTDTLRAKLNRSDLFSNKQSDTLLAYNHVLELRRWNDSTINNILCNLLSLQQRVESNGVTRVVVMPIPDKLFAYSNYINMGQLTSLSITGRIIETSSPNILRLDQFVQQRVQQGEIDFYLPNDTHWSSSGYRQVADYLIETMQTQGILGQARE